MASIRFYFEVAIDVNSPAVPFILKQIHIITMLTANRMRRQAKKKNKHIYTESKNDEVVRATKKKHQKNEQMSEDERNSIKVAVQQPATVQ